MECLLKDRHRITAGDDDAGRKIHRVREALGWCDSLALKDDVVAHGFHAEHADTVLDQNRQDSLFETVEVSVHHVKRHLNRIELESVLRGCGQHLQMNLWTLVAGETYKTDLPRLLSFQHGLQSAALGKDTVWIRISNHFVELE